MVKMKYSLYKNYYNEYPASNYEASTKSIYVDLPKIKSVSFPKTWRRDGNCYFLPDNIKIYVWGSGYGKSYRIEKINNIYDITSIDVDPCVNINTKVIEIVQNL